MFFPDKELELQPSDLDVPKLLVHGTAYDLVPFSMGRACSRAEDLPAPGSFPQTGMP